MPFGVLLSSRACIKGCHRAALRSLIGRKRSGCCAAIEGAQETFLRGWAPDHFSLMLNSAACMHSAAGRTHADPLYVPMGPCFLQAASSPSLDAVGRVLSEKEVPVLPALRVAAAARWTPALQWSWAV